MPLGSWDIEQIRCCFCPHRIYFPIGQMDNKPKSNPEILLLIAMIGSRKKRIALWSGCVVDLFWTKQEKRTSLRKWPLIRIGWSGVCCGNFWERTIQGRGEGEGGGVPQNNKQTFNTFLICFCHRSYHHSFQIFVIIFFDSYFWIRC